MLARIYRLLLAVICCPLLGAYGLRWACGAGGDLLSVLGINLGHLRSFSDMVGSGAGLMLGLVYAISLTTNAWQTDRSPVRASADVILISLAAILLGNLGLARFAPSAAVVAILPPATFVLWAASAAANLQLSVVRREWQSSLRPVRHSRVPQPEAPVDGE
jgi:hypothetical protein